METPYKGLRPYCEDDAAYFFGRDAEIELVCEVFRAARLSIVFGPRGIGKTSLLHAGVAPHLRRTAAQAENVIVFDCGPEDPLARFGVVLRNASRERVPNFLSIDSIIKTISCGEKLLIILDQFEECVTRNIAFTAELTRLMGERDLSMHFLLAVRDEAEFALQPLLARLPNVFDGMLRLRPLSDTAARAAIVGPIEVFNSRNPGLEVHIEPEAIEAILTAAKDDAANHIDTVKLQRILAALWDYEFSSGMDTLRHASVNSLVARDDSLPAKEAEIFDDLWPSTLLTPAEPLPAAISLQPEPATKARARKGVFAYVALTAFALAAAMGAFFALNDDPEPQIALREPTIPAPLTAAEPRVPPPTIAAPQAETPAPSTEGSEKTIVASTQEPDKPVAPSEKTLTPPTPKPAEKMLAPSIQEPEKPTVASTQESKKPVGPLIPETEKSNPPVAQSAAKDIASSPAPAPIVSAREPRIARAPGESRPPAGVVPARERSSPSVAKSPADQAAAAQDNFPRVFIHVRERSPATSQLVKELEQNGIAVSGVKKVDRGPRLTDLRYFHPREKKEANEIARRLKQFDIKIAQVKYIKGYEEAAPDRQYELWFPPDALN